MSRNEQHTFHIPVMGLGYTIDTPIKVARFGITSVVSIIQDILIEHMREYYTNMLGEKFEAIPMSDIDHRAKRVTAYLNLMDRIVKDQVSRLREERFEDGSEIEKYFLMLPNDSPVRKMFIEMKEMEEGEAKLFLQKQLRLKIQAGGIDVNIMTKLDNTNYDPKGEPLPTEYSDGLSALRGYANSTLSSSIVFSAGLNPRLYSYCETFSDFYPNEEGEQKKKIILKVSDYRSAMIQGKFLAKKGLWISEFRIESGLNCGGHAFPTEGFLLGPILAEFKEKRHALTNELFAICNKALEEKKLPIMRTVPFVKLSVQGGIGTAEEDSFLRNYFNVDLTGWGSPFLLVPEATNVDNDTLKQLSTAIKDDYFVSRASPLGIPFNNFRKSSSEVQRLERIRKKRPGSPCYKRYLAFNTEFTKRPICVSSREYQHAKIAELEKMKMNEKDFIEQFNEVTEKDCLCEGLAVSALLVNKITPPHHLQAVTICPGPNLAFFSGIFSLREMVNHIYGRISLLNKLNRPHMFINELYLYVDYLKKEIEKGKNEISAKSAKYLSSFKSNLLSGINYYKELIPKMNKEAVDQLEKLKFNLIETEQAIKELILPEPVAG